MINRLFRYSYRQAAVVEVAAASSLVLVFYYTRTNKYKSKKSIEEKDQVIEEMTNDPIFENTKNLSLDN